MSGHSWEAFRLLRPSGFEHGRPDRAQLVIFGDIGQVFDKPKPPEASAAVGEVSNTDKPEAANTNPILHRIQEAILQVKRWC